jgi:SAM-dependent methyltransferase
VSTGSREDWERKWATNPDAGFDWFLGEAAPAELVEILGRTDLPHGAGLDVGCGAGSITVRIAERFRPAVGFDITMSAVRQAVTRAAPGISFLVAASPDFPFPDHAFAFIFDRGCLQHVPRASWPAYFASVDRMLAPGGLVELLIPGQPRPAPFSMRGIRARLARIRRRRGGSRMASMSRSIERHVPSGMLVETMDTYPVRLPSGIVRLFTHAVLRKPAAGTHERP